MARKLDLIFWVTVILIVVLGTVGGVLYKYGTNALGTIDYARLVQVQKSWSTILLAGLLFLSIVLFFLSGYSLRSHSFAALYLFSPVIFLALVIFAVSRFLIGVPLSVTGLGRLTGLLTALSVVATALASNFIFHETFSTREVAGLGLAVAAVILLGE
jgi:drug/metabolite transporter (DMT)-like permease